jgi:hypothetical protein
MAQILPLKNDVARAGPEPLTESSVRKVEVPPNSKPRACHPPRQKSQNSKSPAKTKLLPDAKLLVSREETAQMLSISIRGVDYLIATKRLSTRRIGTRVLIPIEDVRRFARSDHPERMAG